MAPFDGDAGLFSHRWCLALGNRRVMVAQDRDGASRHQLAHFVDDPAGVAAITDKVAQQRVIGRTPCLCMLQHGGKGLGDIDVKEAAKVISENLDESMIANIVIPMFKGCALSEVESKRKLDSETAINQAFTVENLLDLYELIFEVGRFQFSPFLEQLKSRFGNLLDAKPKAKLTES